METVKRKHEIEQTMERFLWFSIHWYPRITDQITIDIIQRYYRYLDEISQNKYTDKLL